jgi:hypothetical protein
MRQYDFFYLEKGGSVCLTHIPSQSEDKMRVDVKIPKRELTRAISRSILSTNKVLSVLVSFIRTSRPLHVLRNLQPRQASKDGGYETLLFVRFRFHLPTSLPHPTLPLVLEEG